MIRTVRRLRESGICVAVLDLTGVGQNLTPEQWYAGLLFQLGEHLNLEEVLIDHWHKQRELGSMQRWIRAIREVVLVRCRAPIVVFVDEIDMVRSLPFSADEFFAGIRQCYNERSEHVEMRRLSFSFLGVAAPSDLVRDTRMTPFNIGQRIELYDFSAIEAFPLARGLTSRENLGQTLLRRILYWTGGHPYLTQRLCLEVARSQRIRGGRDVDRLCAELFLCPNARTRDDNLLFVRERMLNGEGDLAAVLDLYQRISRGQTVVDDEANPLVSALRLTGITRSERNRLKVRNRIYSYVFDRKWIQASQPHAELRRQQAAYRRGLLRAALIATLVVVAIGSLAIVAWQQRRQAILQVEDNRRLLYDREMGLAQQAWAGANLDRVNELLQETIPAPGKKDLRGFEWYQFWRETHEDLLSLKEDNPILGLSLAPEGRILAVAELLAWRGRNNELLLKLYDLDTRKVISSLAIPSDTGFDLVAFTPDRIHAIVADPYLSAGSATATLWNLSSRLPVVCFKGHKDRISSLTISPDGKRLATADVRGVTLVWDVASGKRILKLPEQGNRITSLSFSSTAQQLASTDDTSRVRIWDISSGRELAPVIALDSVVNTAVFFPDGRRLLTATQNGNLQIWDLAARKAVSTLSSHSGLTQSIAFSPDGSMLATGNYDRTVAIWSVTDSRLLRTIKGHGGAVGAIEWSKDGHNLITGSVDTTVKIWAVRDNEEQVLPHEKVKAYLATTFSSTNELFSLGVTAKNQVKLWNLSRGEEVASLGEDGRHLLCAAFSPNGKLAATGGMDNVIRLWDLSAGKLVNMMSGHTSYVYALSFSPDGSLLVSGGKDQTIRLWDTSTGSAIALLKSDLPDSWRAAFSPNARYLASASLDGSVKIWDVSAQRLLRVLHGHVEKVTAIAFSPDGLSLATGSDDNTVRLWEVATGNELKRLGLADQVQRAVFSPDGKRLVTGGVEGTLKLWDMITGQELMTLKPHTDEITSVTISTDGMSLATSSLDGTIGLWRGAKESQGSQR